MPEFRLRHQLPLDVSFRRLCYRLVTESTVRLKRVLVFIVASE